MRLLYIGGTGLISSACARLAVVAGHEVHVLNRGKNDKHPLPAAVRVHHSDVNSLARAIDADVLGDFDAVVDFLAFNPLDIDKHFGLFSDICGQYVFISTASVYQKPPQHYVVTERTPRSNPFWEYARQKIAAEDRLRELTLGAAKATIVRPSLTYGLSQIPLCTGSWQHPWAIIDRMIGGGEVVVPGDGSSLWCLTWNEDFARGLLGLLGNPRAYGEDFHITSDEILTWDQIYSQVFTELGIEPKVAHISAETIGAFQPDRLGSLLGDKVNSTMFDNSKIKRVVPEFVCKTAWAEGIRRALDWFRSHPHYQTLDPAWSAATESMLAAYKRILPTE